MKVLITTALKNTSYYLNLLPQKTVLDAISFIEITFLTFDVPEDINWIFFSSKNSFDAYRTQHSMDEHVRLGCVSEGTKEHINDCGFHVDYCGDPGKSIVENARSFSNVVDGKVLFPSSDQTLSSFTQYLAPEQIVEKTAYRTVLRSKKLDKQYDFYCFTSPSNVRSFFMENALPNESACIAIGTSTFAELKNYVETSKIHSSRETSIESMIKEVKKLMN